MTDLQQDAAGRAGRRLALGLLGVLVAVVATVPLAVLVRRQNPGLVHLDVRLSDAAEAATARHDLLRLVAKGVTLLGEPVLLTVVALALAAWLHWRGASRLAAYVLVARVGATLISHSLKLVVDRARPVFDEPVATALGPSFPSGHALGSAAFCATVAVLLLPRARRPRLLLAGAVAVSVLVALSRVLLGVHYPSDVTAGLLIGWGWAALCTAVFAAWRVEEGRPLDVAGQGIGTR